MQALEKNAENTQNPYNYYESILRRLILQFKDVEKSEEAAHQACMKAINNRHRYDKQKGGYYAWLYRIAFCCYLDILRKEKNHQKYLHAQPVEKYATENPEAALFQKEYERQVAQILQRLSPLEREVFSLRYIQEYKNKEIAKILGYSSSSVAYIICKAKKKIKEICKQKE